MSVENNPSFEKKTNILVRFPNWIGDVLMATPALWALRANFPKAHISVLIKSDLAPLLEDNDHVDRLIPYSPGQMSVLSRLLFYRTLKKYQFDLTLLFTNSFESALASWISNSKERVGYKRDMRGFLLTKRVVVPPRIPPRIHQSEYYMNLVKEIGGTIHSQSIKLKIPEKVLKDSDNWWNENGLKSSHIVIGIGAGASFGSAKRWPAERFSLLAIQLVKELNCKIIVFGSKNDEKVAKLIVDPIGDMGISMAGKSSLKTLAALIKKCDLYISNDSGPMHIASAVETPILAIFGSTDPSETSPLSPFYKIIRKDLDCSPCWKRDCPDHRCMDLITVQNVTDCVKALLASRKNLLYKTEK